MTAEASPVAHLVGREILREPLLEDALEALAEVRGLDSVGAAALYATLRGLEAAGYLDLDPRTGWAPGPNLTAFRTRPAALPENVVPFPARRVAEGGAA